MTRRQFRANLFLLGLLAIVGAIWVLLNIMVM